MTQLQRFGEEALSKKVEDLSKLETYKVLIQLEEFKLIKHSLKEASDSEIAATLLKAYLE